MWQMHNLGWGWWVIGSIGMVAFWALVLYGLLLLVRGDSRSREDERRPEAREAPLAVLNRRLAAGEISLDEYEQLRDAITREPAAPAAA